VYYENFNLRIDGTVIPPPSGYGFSEADLVENSNRNADGYLSWDTVRQNVGKLDLTWDNLDGGRLQAVIAAIRGKKKFMATFFNPNTGDWETREFYAGDRATQLARFISAARYYASLTVPFVEV